MYGYNFSFDITSKELLGHLHVSLWYGGSNYLKFGNKMFSVIFQCMENLGSFLPRFY